MGQKSDPNALRLGINKSAYSNWFAKGADYSRFVHTDILIRKFIQDTYKQSGISHVQIERPAQNAHVRITCARPGMIIGKKGNDAEILRRKLSNIVNIPVHVTVEEEKKDLLVSKLVAEAVASQLERRVMFRRAMKKAVSSTMRAGAKGIKVIVSGRLGGAEIARSEMVKDGRVPLHTFRSDVDYAVAEAHTTYGVIGVKVWIYKGEVYSSKES
ncbi:MAG: 30S ribosomal protein S3 [Gammaproteobacteria bacterium]|nr:30S ribosomal protein S3 [Gammaproteobacteria bacterium]